MSLFDKVNWLSLQQPLIMVVAMVTGKDINKILALNVHQRLILIEEVLGQVGELVNAGVMATDPVGPGGVTLTEEEYATIVDEADDIVPAVEALLDSFQGDDPA